MKYNFKPFDKVLVRDAEDKHWLASLYSHHRDDKTNGYNYVMVDGVGYRCCIPYEGNEHLVGTTNFPTDLEQPTQNVPNLKDYKTIKTYEDACTALSEKVDEVALTNAGVPKHIIALMKLELVCKALWGGVVKVYPDPTGNRTYYYPWFALYTKDEVERMNSEKKGLLLSATAGDGAGAGWGGASTGGRSSASVATGGFRLCLDTCEKAGYFGAQFLELWTEYLAYNFTVGERLK